MRKYAKILCLILVITTFISVLASCAASDKLTHSGILKKPKNCGISIWPGEEIKDTSKYEYEETGYNKRYYDIGYSKNDSSNTNVTFYLDNDIVKSVHITDSNVSIYGLTLDSSIEDFKLFFEAQGFSYTYDIPIKSDVLAIPDEKYCFAREEFKVYLYPNASEDGFRSMVLSYDRPTFWTDIDY